MLQKLLPVEIAKTIGVQSVLDIYTTKSDENAKCLPN